MPNHINPLPSLLIAEISLSDNPFLVVITSNRKSLTSADKSVQKSILTKTSVIQGKLSDASPFNKLNVEDIYKVLKENDFEEYGDDVSECVRF